MGKGRRYSKTNVTTVAKTVSGLAAYMSIVVFLSKLSIVPCVLRTISDGPLTSWWHYSGLSGSVFRSENQSNINFHFKIPLKPGFVFLVSSHMLQ